MALSNKQKQYLKGLAHALKPVVQLGGNGFTEGVLAEIDNALAHHELIKVKVPSEDRDEKSSLWTQLYVRQALKNYKSLAILLLCSSQVKTLR